MKENVLGMSLRHYLYLMNVLIMLRENFLKNNIFGPYKSFLGLGDVYQMKHQWKDDETDSETSWWTITCLCLSVKLSAGMNGLLSHFLYPVSEAIYKQQHPYLSFHNFSTQKELRNAWVRLIRRDEGPFSKIIHGSTFVCTAVCISKLKMFISHIFNLLLKCFYKYVCPLQMCIPYLYINNVTLIDHVSYLLNRQLITLMKINHCYIL